MTSSLAVKNERSFDPETGHIQEKEVDKPLQGASYQLYKHYKPDLKPVIYSLSNHFEKSEMRASKVSGVATEEMLTESSPIKVDNGQ